MPKQCSLRLWPAVAANPTSQNLSNYDRVLDVALAQFAEARTVHVIRPDMKAFEDAIWVSPTAYGFTNLTDNAEDLSGCDPSRCYHWDSFHVTTAANRLWAEFIYREISPPLVAALRSATVSGLLELQWCGGSRPFRVQHCDDLVSALWQSGDLTFQTNTVVAP